MRKQDNGTWLWQREVLGAGFHSGLWMEPAIVFVAVTDGEDWPLWVYDSTEVLFPCDCY